MTGARGVHLALAPADPCRLHRAAQQGDDAVWELVFEELEEDVPPEWQHSTDKAWDAIHRCLTDGHLGDDNGEPPLNLAVVGGIHLVRGDSGVVSVCPASQVRAVSDALEAVTRRWLRKRDFAIEPEDYGAPSSEADFDYTWSNFCGLPELYARAARAGDRAVVFTVDF